MSRSTWACELKWCNRDKELRPVSSRSTWACELKLMAAAVAIKTWSHAPRERVSWNQCDANYLFGYKVTLHVSVWVEMKIGYDFRLKNIGHAPRERVSWNLKRQVKPREQCRHAPRERVSWNTLVPHGWIDMSVTLHVSVWVEISLLCRCRCLGCVTLHVSVWVEIGRIR